MGGEIVLGVIEVEVIAVAIQRKGVGSTKGDFLGLVVRDPPDDVRPIVGPLADLNPGPERDDGGLPSIRDDRHLGDHRALGDVHRAGEGGDHLQTISLVARHGVGLQPANRVLAAQHQRTLGVERHGSIGGQIDLARRLPDVADVGQVQQLVAGAVDRRPVREVAAGLE